MPFLLLLFFYYKIRVNKGIVDFNLVPTFNKSKFKKKIIKYYFLFSYWISLVGFLRSLFYFWNSFFLVGFLNCSVILKEESKIIERNLLDYIYVEKIILFEIFKMNYHISTC